MNHSWSECVIALYKSKIHRGIYRKMLADHTIESARNAGADFYLKEDRSGVFTLGRTGKNALFVRSYGQFRKSRNRCSRKNPNAENKNDENKL